MYPKVLQIKFWTHKIHPIIFHTALYDDKDPSCTMFAGSQTTANHVLFVFWNQLDAPEINNLSHRTFGSLNNSRSLTNINCLLVSGGVEIMCFA